MNILRKNIAWDTFWAVLFALAIFSLVMTACSPDRIDEAAGVIHSDTITAIRFDGPNMGKGMVRYIDSEYNVVCWKPIGGTGIGISCIPMVQLGVKSQ